MAYVKKSGSRFEVHQGNNNVLLSTFTTKDKAQSHVRELHKANDPKLSNRGKNAANRFKK